MVAVERINHDSSSCRPECPDLLARVDLLLAEDDVLVVLTKTHQPAVEIYDIEPAPRRLDRMRRVVEQVWRAIEAGFYPAPSPFICLGCPYRESCQAWR